MAMTPAERVATSDAVRRQADGVAERASTYALSVVREYELAREKRRQEQPPESVVLDTRATIERAFMAGVLAGMEVEVAFAVRAAVTERNKRLADKKARGRR